MQLRLLGPVEAVHEGRPVPLGGLKQRATLGYLLLRANQVVPTSQLIDALWCDDEAPTSARKILQNAVWGLRRALSEVPSSTGVDLSTQAPGYILRLDPANIDLHRFHQMADQGRAEMASGSPETAAATLREALSIWRGSAGADLVEAGVCWPELDAVERSRLDVMEDRFDAELLCGRHKAVLGELAALVDTDRLRERACGQLMLALYRCGRHADALSVYARTRSALVEGLGLEPGPALQKLQHAVLTHDPALDLPGSSGIIVATAGPLTESVSEPGPRVPRPRDATPTQHASVVIVDARPGPAGAAAPAADADVVLTSVAAMIRAGIEQSGGTVVASIGSATTAVFLGRSPDDAVSAVRTAVLMRDLFGANALPALNLAGAGRLAVSAAVTTGELPGPNDPDPSRPPVVGRGLVDRCQNLLSGVPDGEVVICDATRQLVGHAMPSLATAAVPRTWRVDTHGGASGRAGGTSEHEPELTVLQNLLTCTVHRSTPQLVTVLGEAPALAPWFMTEVQRRIVAAHPRTLVLRGRVHPSTDTRALAAQREILHALCEIHRDDSADTARLKLAGTLRRVCTVEEAHRLFPLLAPLLVATEPAPRADQRALARVPAVHETLAAWEWLLERAAAERPVVVLIDDLHHATDQVLDSVDRFVETAGSVPLLVVVTSRPRLMDRRPRWSGGKYWAACITLDSAHRSGQEFPRRLPRQPEARTRTEGALATIAPPAVPRRFPLWRGAASRWREKP